jgi:hypothetical protein
MNKIPIITTMTAAEAAAEAMAALKTGSAANNGGSGGWSVKPLQDYYHTEK